MARANNPFGFRVARHSKGSDINQAHFTIASGLAANIYKGDPIKRSGANVTLAASGDQTACGIFKGCNYTANGRYQFAHNWPTGTVSADAEVQATSDPDLVYYIQTDTLATSDIGKVADWHAGTPDTTYGTSGAYLLASAAATSGKACKIIGLADTSIFPENAYGAYAVAEVVFSGHDMP
jgi:hypothetical protein